MARLKNSIKNAKVSMFFYLLTMMLGFFSRKTFIHYLGADILGLNTLVSNILNFLNLAELGIGTAVAFSLYKPLYENNKIEINEIVTVQGFLYKKIGLFIAAFALILVPFFPLLFAKEAISISYAYYTFVVLLFSNLLGYFVNYKQALLEADHKQYLIVLCNHGLRAIKTILQIAALIYLYNAYYYWLLLEVLFAILISVSINYMIKRQYPFLLIRLKSGRTLLRKHRIIVQKVKQLFYHKLAGFAVYQSNPIIIYMFSSLNLVTIYGNYMLIISGIVLLIDSIFNGINAGIGNLIQSCNIEKVKTILWELLSARMWIASLLCFFFWELSEDFISLWVGTGFLLDKWTVTLLLFYQFFQMTRISENFLYAYGFFDDIWAGIIEAVLHIGLACLGGSLFGIRGIIGGCVVAVLMIGVIWKPIFLSKKAFSETAFGYFRIFFLNLVLLTLVGWLVHEMWLLLKWNFGSIFKQFVTHFLFTSFSFSIVSFISLYRLSLGFRLFANRIVAKYIKSI